MYHSAADFAACGRTDRRAARAGPAVGALRLEREIPGRRVAIQRVGGDRVAVEPRERAPLVHRDEPPHLALVLVVVDHRLGAAAEVAVFLARGDAVEGRAGGLLAQGGAVIVVVTVERL